MLIDMVSVIQDFGKRRSRQKPPVLARIKRADRFVIGVEQKSKIGMKEFLDWMENNSDSHAGTLAAAKEIHTNLFPKDSKADIQNLYE